MARDRQGESERRDQSHADLAWMSQLGTAMEKLRTQGEALAKTQEQAAKSTEQEIEATRARIAASRKAKEMADAAPATFAGVSGAQSADLPFALPSWVQPDSEMAAKLAAEHAKKQQQAGMVPSAIPIPAPVSTAPTGVPISQQPGINAPVAKVAPPPSAQPTPTAKVVQPVMMQLAPAAAGMARYGSAALAASNANKVLMQAAQGVTNKMEAASKAGLGVALAYGYATSKLLGWINAGLSGTTVGERISYNFNQLHRQIASLFVPAIEKGIKQLERLTNWFRALSGEQQRSLARWAGVSVGMLGVLTLLPKISAGFGLLFQTIAATAVANPFLILAGGLVALMSRTEEGRESLSQMGTAFMEAFSAAADVLSSVLIPALEYLTDAISGPTGKILLFGALGAAALVKVIGAMRAVAVAASGMGGAITLGIGVAVAAIAALVAASQSSTRQFGKDIQDVIEQVKRGTLTMEKAKEEIRLRAFLQAEKEAEEGGTGIAGFKATGGLAEMIEARKKQGAEKRTEELASAGEERLKRFMERGGKGPGAERSDVVTARTGTEDARATFRRLEDAILKTDVGKQQLKTQEEILAEIRKRGGNAPQPDRRENPPKGD